MSLYTHKLDGEGKIVLVIIGAERKLKSGSKRTCRHDVTGRLKWILHTRTIYDRNNLPDVSIISISFMFFFFFFNTVGARRASVDNNSYPSVMTIRR